MLPEIKRKIDLACRAGFNSGKRSNSVQKKDISGLTEILAFAELSVRTPVGKAVSLSPRFLLRKRGRATKRGRMRRRAQRRTELSGRMMRGRN